MSLMAAGFFAHSLFPSKGSISMSDAHLPEFSIDGWLAPGFEPLRAAFARNFDDAFEVGASFSAVVAGEIVADLWGGYVDADLTRPWQEETLVNVYSTTKGIASAVLAALAGDGSIDYAVPVAEYWPELRAGRGGLTVGRLLAHQGGLCGLRRTLAVSDLYHWERMVDWLAAEEPHWEPGSAAGYHAVTWGFLAGELVWRVTGKSLGTVLAERIAGPLGADFHVGLPDTEAHRVATMIGPNRTRARANTGTKPRLSAVANFVMPPMYALALENPVIRPHADVSTPAWRRAEIAAANGHGNARGVARIYGMLAQEGRFRGEALVSATGLAAATREEHVEGPDLVLGRVMRRARGFLLNSAGMYGPGPRAFGHSGAGGSVGFADPDRQLGFGYAMNQMQSGIDNDTRAGRLIKTLYECL
jgi:CubicO group peptidase (beta-lactamase class C family)